VVGWVGVMQKLNAYILMCICIYIRICVYHERAHARNLGTETVHVNTCVCVHACVGVFVRACIGACV